MELPLAFPREAGARLGWLTSITAVPSVSTAAFTVGLPQPREPASPVLTLDGLAGVEQILLFIAEDAPMALQALTAVGERIDGQAGAVYTPTETSNAGKKMCEQTGEGWREDDGRNVRQY